MAEPLNAQAAGEPFADRCSVSLRLLNVAPSIRKKAAMLYLPLVATGVKCLTKCGDKPT
jgi:hypothetical protein